jgi:beta-alanine degradation protein BauB
MTLANAIQVSTHLTLGDFEPLRCEKAQAALGERAFIGAGTMPQPPRPKADPLVHISEPHVRVTEWRFAPGAETGWHRHEADYVVVPLLDGDLLLEEPGGESRTATLKRHVPYARREGVEHNVINANPFDFAFIEIEHLKP